MSRPKIRPSHGRANRIRIPGLSEQPPAQVIDAYWIAADLAESGWRLVNIDFDPNTATGFVTAHAPTRRVVTVSWDLRGPLRSRQQVPGRAAQSLLILAHHVADLGQIDAEAADDHPLLGRLCALLWQFHTTSVLPKRNWYRSEPLPTLPADRQPSRPTREAAWIIARLAVKYGWGISHIGDTIAAGGFIADIPGDVLAVFPAAMLDDGTAAASLARLIPQLDTAERAALQRLDYRALWALAPISQRWR